MCLTLFIDSDIIIIIYITILLNGYLFQNVPKTGIEPMT